MLMSAAAVLRTGTSSTSQCGHHGGVPVAASAIHNGSRQRRVAARVHYINGAGVSR